MIVHRFPKGHYAGTLLIKSASAPHTKPSPSRFAESRPAAVNYRAVYLQELHALDLATGAEKFGGPVAIEAPATGTGAVDSR